MWKIEYADEAVKQLKRLGKIDTKRILLKIAELSCYDRILAHPQVKFLTGTLKGFFRLRISDFRVIFKVNYENKPIMVFTILHRKDAYR